MRITITLVAVTFLVGCAVAPITYVGDGSYAQLQTDRYECAQETSTRTDTISGASSSSSLGANAGVSGNSSVSCSTQMFVACLGARGWKRVYDGSGVGVANAIRCANP